MATTSSGVHTNSRGHVIAPHLETTRRSHSSPVFARMKREKPVTCLRGIRLDFVDKSGCKVTAVYCDGRVIYCKFEGEAGSPNTWNSKVRLPL